MVWSSRHSVSVLSRSDFPKLLALWHPWIWIVRPADYLIYEDVPRRAPVAADDVDLYEHFERAQALSQTDRAVLKHVIDALAARQQANTFVETLATQAETSDKTIKDPPS